MSEDIDPIEHKEYLLLVDEKALVLLSQALPYLKFVEVKGVKVDAQDYQLLVNPMKKIPESSPC